MKHEADFDLDINQLSWIVATMDLGNFISPLFAGYLMDKVGRKLSTVILGPLFVVSWLLTLFVPTAWALYTARMLAGLGKGISYTVVPVFLGEIAGIKIRGALSSAFCVQLHLGFLFEAVVGPMVSYRTLNILSTIVPVMFVLAVVWIPESPYYLLKKNRPAEAAKCLQWFTCKTDVSVEIQRMEVNVKREMENQSTFREVFTSRKDLRALTIVVVVCACQRAGGISCIYAYSSLLLPDPAPIIGKSVYLMIFATMIVVVNFIGLALVDKVGRKPLLLFSEVGLGTINFVFALYFYTNDNDIMDTTKLTWLPYMCHFLFSIVFSIGLGFIPVVFLSEMFPVNIRSHCSVIVSMTLAFFSFFTNKIFLLVYHYYGYYVMFCVFSIVNFASAVYTYKYVIETKGKTFHEIQESLHECVKRNNKM